MLLLVDGMISLRMNISLHVLIEVLHDEPVKMEGNGAVMTR